MMMYWGTGMGGWAMLLMTVSNLLFLGLLIAGAIALIRYTSRSARQDSAAEPAPAQRVLADRFARVGGLFPRRSSGRRHQRERCV